MLRQAGCSVTVHADALNLSAHRQSFAVEHIDVIEAFTPPPVGDLSLADARASWGEHVVFHVNIPESIFYSGEAFCYEWTRDLLLSDPNPRKFLSFTELGFLGVAGDQMRLFRNGMRGILNALDDFGAY